MSLVRKLNDLGLLRFAEYLQRCAAGEPLSPPSHLLEDPDSSEALLGTAEVDEKIFDSKWAAAIYLVEKLGAIDKTEVDDNVGLWSWLSLFYLDQVCPAARSGERNPGELVRHVLSQHSQKYYRHLIAGPYKLQQLHGQNARVFLYGPLTEHGDFSEQLASRMQLITNRALVQAVDYLYFEGDAGDGGKPKRGSLTRTRQGNLRRLIAVIQQFDLTYDLYAMSKDQILELLPAEFDRWRN